MSPMIIFQNEILENTKEDLHKRVMDIETATNEIQETYKLRTVKGHHINFTTIIIYFCDRLCSGEKFMRVLWDTLNHDKVS